MKAMSNKEAENVIKALKQIFAADVAYNCTVKGLVPIVCPLHSDNEVIEYCVEGPCVDWLERRCPIMERSEDGGT